MHERSRSPKRLLSAWKDWIASVAVTRMHPLIQLRWIAVSGQVATIVFVHFVLGISLPLESMAVVLAGLITFNVFSMKHWHDRREVSNLSLFLALLVDVLTLTLQLHLSGGATNPFIFLYLLQVVLAAVLLQPWAGWAIAGITGTCFVGLTLWPGPVVLPDAYRSAGLLICFVLNAALVVVFINRISRILRAHDEHIAAMRQRAAEEEHIVRMGLLASGAAHELGTPLSTMAVILGDWQHLPHFNSDPELLQDVIEMQAQVLRCKATVTGILLSAGETRGESPERMPAVDFFDDLVTGWKATRQVREFGYQRRIDEDVTIVCDEGLKQMICNVLDNALEVSPDHVTLEAQCKDDDLVIRVRDRGPGFTPAMLAQFGRPYQSSKGRPGSGLGLFLSLNVARTLGGNIFAQNHEEGGAVVTMVLPLAALTLEEEAVDG